MSTSPDDSEYPYSAQPPLQIIKTRRPMIRVPWRFIRHLFWRMLAIVVIALPIAAIGVGIVAYRAHRQSEIAAELSKHGLYYVHWHEFDDYDDRVPGFLRKWLGDDFWNDIGYINGHAKSVEATNAFCEAFGKLPRLRGIGITSDSLTFEQLNKWPHFNRLEDLALWSPRITDDDLATIGRISTLRTLSLKSPKITDVGLARLFSLSDLKSLEIWSAQLVGSALRNERGFPHLTELTLLDSPQLNDETILSLGQMPELHEVVITECLISDRSLVHIASGGKLGSLKLNGTKVTDAGIGALAGTDLSSIELEDTEITDVGFHTLMRIPSLTFFWLSDTKITGSGASSREEGERIDLLDLNGCPLTHDGVVALANAKYSSESTFSANSSLWLHQTPLNDQDLMLFVNNDEIENLNVSDTKVTAAGVVAFYEARKRRLEGASQKETLTLSCDFPDAVESYLPKDEFLSIDGTPLDIAPPPPDPDQPPPPTTSPESYQPPPAEPQSPIPPNA